MSYIFNDQRFLFKTITMAHAETFEAISDAIASKKGWHSGRYAQSERQYYITRRKCVEHHLYTEYVEAYGPLQQTTPIYFYLFPNITKAKALELAQQRTTYDEHAPKIAYVNIHELHDLSNITFTLNDSFTSYRKKALASGINSREEEKDRPIFPDHNRIFPFSMLDLIHRKYQDMNPYYEVQIWNAHILEDAPVEILSTS